MRICLGFFLTLALIAACAPQATVRKASPVADLKVYRKVLVRGQAGQMAAWQGEELANRTAAQLQALCGFDAVFTGTDGGRDDFDLIVDLNILSTGRGGGGIIKNPNLAVVDVAMILSDGLNDELLGSAQIRGQSSAVLVNGANPEQQALTVVSQEVGKILLKSGCGGARIARTDPVEPEPPPKAEKPEVTEEQIAEAEAANSRGKELFRGAKVGEARAEFERAIELNPDPRYIMNLCLAHEALNDYDTAIETCERVIDAKPEPRLAKKAEQRIILIADKKKNAG